MAQSPVYDHPLVKEARNRLVSADVRHFETQTQGSQVSEAQRRKQSNRLQATQNDFDHATRTAEEEAELWRIYVEEGLPGLIRETTEEEPAGQQ